MVNSISSKNIIKYTVSVLAVIVMLVVFGVSANAESYKAIKLDVPRVSQRPGTGDCAIASMSTVEAYCHGLPSGNYNSKAYQAVYSANGYSVSANWSKIGYQTIEGFSMKTAYDQLKTGYPIIVHRTSNHYSVVYGYDGNTSSLEMSGFMIVDVDDSYNGKSTAYQRLNGWIRGGRIDRMVVRLDGLAISSDSLKINGNHPAALHEKGNSFAIHGMVISNKNITNVTVAVKSASGNAVQTYNAAPNSTSFALSKASGTINIPKLAVGNYVYSVTAKDSSGASKTTSFSFKVCSGSNVPADDVKPEIKKVSYKAIVTAEVSINLRMSASIDSEKITTIPGGEVLDVTAECNGWAMVNYKGHIGWISMDYTEKYLEPAINPPILEPALPASENGKYARITSKTALKSSKKTASANVTTLSKNAIVKVLKSETDWIKVSFSGKEGYIQPSACIEGLLDVDKNGFVNSSDSLAVLESSINMKKLSSSVQKVADADGNGTVNSSDALIILQVATGEKTF